jgi:hypothetical protein
MVSSNKHDRLSFYKALSLVIGQVIVFVPLFIYMYTLNQIGPSSHFNTNSRELALAIAAFPSFFIGIYASLIIWSIAYNRGKKDALRSKSSTDNPDSPS